jgi:quercetin dioxygenase-like cupin family protein
MAPPLSGKSLSPTKERGDHDGETFYEGPNDVHVVDRNASSTEPAKFVVVLIKDKGAPALVPPE